MRYIFASALLLSTVISSGANASLKCNTAVQNWQNGSAQTCPYDSNGGVTAAAVQLAPIVDTPPVIVAPPILVECGALSKDILPLILRKKTVADFAGNLEAPEEIGCDR